MVSVRLPSSMAQKTLVGVALVCLTTVGGGIAPRTFAATSRAAATVTTSQVAYHLAAQLLSGPNAGSTIAGQVSGTQDSTGLLTATLTLANGLSAKVIGSLAAPAKLTLSGKAGAMTLSGSALNQKAGIWGGMITLGTSPNAGAWTLTPETQTVSFSLGGKTAVGSTDKMALAGQLTLQLTADGWGEGTFAFLANNTVLQVEGRLSNGNLTATIFWPPKGAVLLVATGKPAVGVTKWTGTFVGPGPNDFGTFLGEG